MLDAESAELDKLDEDLSLELSLDSDDDRSKLSESNEKKWCEEGDLNPKKRRE